jgi:N-acetyl-anhydromuramyl-L-alanine amidase AmpD
MMKVDLRYYLGPAQCFVEKAKKDRIVLHGTAGRSAASAVRWWSATPERVGTAFIIDEDGTIYQIFPPGSAWAYHLGKQGAAEEKRCIGIELVNVGPLKKRGDTMYWWPENFSTEYATADPGQFIRAPWRGFTYYATYADMQYKALRELLPRLSSEFGIPTVRGKDKQPGVYAHSDFRKDKWDVGPAFDWKRAGIIEPGNAEGSGSPEPVR